MSNPKYITYVQSTKFDEKWKIELWDTDYVSGPSVEIGTSTPPMLTYESQNDKRYAAIKGSSLSVPIIVDNTSIENWLFNEVQLAKEERFYAHLYKWDTINEIYNLYWIGVLLHDLNEREDAAFPYTYELKFTDGLARLKDFKFTELADSTNPLSYTIQTLNWYLYECLKRTPFYARASSGYQFYGSSVNFYEYNMVTSGTHWSTNVDPLDQTSVYPKAFCNTLSNGQLEAFTFYDILEQILTLFNARILLANAYFRIVSVNNYNNSSWKERTYLADGTFEAQTLVAWDSDINQTDEWASSGTNVWQYFPAIKSIVRKFNTSNNNLVDSNINIFQVAATHTGEITGGNKMQIKGSFAVSLSYASGGLNPNDYLQCFIKVQVGSYYLKTDPITNITSWSTSSADRYILNIPLTSTSFLFNLNIVTPELAAGQHTDSEIIVTNISYTTVTLFGTAAYALTQSSFTWSDSTYTATLLNVKNSLIFNSYNESSDQNYLLYRVNNTTSLINSEDIELLESQLGDTIKGANGALYTGPSFAPLISTSSWKVDGSGTAYDINNLLLIETIAPQIYPNPRYQGNIITNGHPYNRYLYQGSKYLLNGGELNLESMEWSGEWFKIYRNISTVDVDDNTPIEETPSFSGFIADNTKGVFQQQKQNGYYSAERIIAAITSNISGTITSIECTVLRALKTGDKLIIIPSYSGDIIECELDSDCAIDDTSITIVEQTFVDDIPAGSLIFVPFNKPVLDTLRVNGLAMFDGNISFDGIPTSDPHINGRVYRDGNHNLKISNG